MRTRHLIPRRSPPRHQVLLAVCALLPLSTTRTSEAASGQWEHQPYRVHVLLAIDAPGRLQDQLERELPDYLRKRTDAAVGPIWQLELELPDAAQRTSLIDGLYSAELPAHKSPEKTDSADYHKLMQMSVRATNSGFDLRAREYDVYVDHWGAVTSDHCDQRAALAERLFQLLRRTFAPLARLQLDPENEERVLLELQGGKVFAKDSQLRWVEPGDVLLPVLRRTTGDGELVEDGIQVVPWTYLTAADIDGDLVEGNVLSGTRRPFGVRRRGRVEQLAIAIRGEPEPVTVHLHSRSEPEKPLVGYEVYGQDPKDESLQLIGHTDRLGRLSIEPGENRVQILFLKNGGQLLARVPVVAGLTPELDIPLPDDDARLQAEAALSALRENLIDVVAQRSILMVRTRRQLEDGELQRARQLLDQLDGLPGRSQFSRELDQLASQYSASDPQIKQRINKLFSETRNILGHFLNADEINELRDQLNAAGNAGG